MSTEEMNELARIYANRTQFMSDYPHDWKSSFDGYLKALEHVKLTEPVVNRSLPTKEQLEFYKLGMEEGLKEKGYNKTDINTFILGFENCIYFIEQKPSDNG